MKLLFVFYDYNNNNYPVYKCSDDVTSFDYVASMSMSPFKDAFPMEVDEKGCLCVAVGQVLGNYIDLEEMMYSNYPEINICDEFNGADQGVFWDCFVETMQEYKEAKANEDQVS